MPRVPVSPPNAQYIGKEFPNESGGAGPFVRGSAPGRWSVLYHQQTFRRPVRGYRPRDIGLLPGGREKRSNGPYRHSFELRGYVSNGTQVPGTATRIRFNSQEKLTVG